MSIVFEQVSFSYDDDRAALEEVSLEVGDGEFLGVVGRTGSGKSTLAQLMDALLVPTSGTVTVDGLDTSKRSLRHDVRRRVGLLFQHSEMQLFASTVAEELAFGAKNLGLGAEETERRSRNALALVGLDYDETAHVSPFELSGGLQRRVALADILVMEPNVLVLDEPLAGLDSRASKDVRDVLGSLHADGMTIVLVSHSMEDVAELCDRVVVMDRGHVAMAGAPEEVFVPERADELRELDLDVPHATRFAIELAQRGLPVSRLVLTSEHLADALANMMEKGR